MVLWFLRRDPIKGYNELGDGSDSSIIHFYGNLSFRRLLEGEGGMQSDLSTVRVNLSSEGAGCKSWRCI